MEIYKKNTGIKTCWATAENPHCEKGQGGKQGNGRKGCPAIRPFAAGQTVVLAEAEGRGIIRRIWITVEKIGSPEFIKSVKLEIYWDGAKKPAVSAPLGDFFCCPLGLVKPFENSFFSSPEGRSFNSYLPMPFKKGMKIILKNESQETEPQLYYEVDYTLGDDIGDDALYLHAFYNLDKNTAEGEDYLILSKVEGCGRFIGASVGLNVNKQMRGSWWGEGEVKCYIDGDSKYPSLCGTGTEDYAGSGWGIGEYSHKEQGCLTADEKSMQYSFYRFHCSDPIYFEQDIKVCLQSIGCAGKNELKEIGLRGLALKYAGGGQINMNNSDICLFERFGDDICSVSYFYLDKPENNLI